MENGMASLDNGKISSQSFRFHHGPGQSYEEVQHLLLMASVELDSERRASKVQEEVHEGRMRRMEELLNTVRRERDEYREKCIELQRQFLPNSHMTGSVVKQELPGRSLSGLQSLETVSSAPEPLRPTRSEVHRKSQGKHHQLELQSQMGCISSMTEPTRDTLVEVHRKREQQQQQQQQQHLGLQQYGMPQLQQRIDLPHQHSSNHSQLDQLDLRPSLSTPHLDFQAQQQQQHQLGDIHQHLDLQQKEHLQDQQRHMDMVINERQAVDATHNEVDNGSAGKSPSWNEFPSGVHLDIHSPDDLILDSPDHNIHIKLTQGLPSPHVDQRSPPHLDDLQLQLQQQEGMQIHIQQQQQESEQLLHMQQGQKVDPRGLHLHDDQPLRQHDDQPLRRQRSKLSNRDGQAQISGGLQGTNDSVMSMSVLQQHSSWTGGLMGLSSPPLSNGCANGLSEQVFQQSSCLQSGSVVASLLSPLGRFGDSAPSSMLLPRPVHLPEPPEADPQVMLKSLPERGKFVEAMRRTPPALSTLLGTAPLPQWVYPPPPLGAEDIPRVSMVAATGIMPPVEQPMGLMSSHGSGLEQMMLLSAPSIQSNPSQNGFCH